MLLGRGHSDDRHQTRARDGDGLRPARRRARSGSCPGTCGGASARGRSGCRRSSRRSRRLDPDVACLQEVWIDDRAATTPRRGGSPTPRRRAPRRPPARPRRRRLRQRRRVPVADHRRRGARRSRRRRRRRAADLRAGRHRRAPRAAPGVLHPPQLALRPVRRPPAAGARRSAGSSHESPSRSYPADPVRRHERDPDSDEIRMLTGRAAVPVPEARVPRRVGGGRRSAPVSRGRTPTRTR